MLNKLREWLSDAIRPKGSPEPVPESDKDAGTQPTEDLNGFEDPEYTMNLERTLRILESSLHNSDNSEEIAIQTNCL